MLKSLAVKHSAFEHTKGGMVTEEKDIVSHVEHMVPDSTARNAQRFAIHQGQNITTLCFNS